MYIFCMLESIKTTPFMTDGTKKKVERLNTASEKIVKAYSFYKEEEEDVPPKIKSYIDNVLGSCANQQQVTKEVYIENDIKGKHMCSLDFTIEKLSKCSICHKTFQNDNYRKKYVCKITKM